MTVKEQVQQAVQFYKFYKFLGRGKSQILLHIIVLELWNIKSSVFAYHILAFLTLRCAYITVWKLYFEI